MLVSIGVIALNEEKMLPGILEDIKFQDYPKELIELILIDSGSSDSTKEIMENFKKTNSDFYAIKILDNPGKKQAAGWNVAIRNFKGDVLVRIDAHAKIPKNFISENVKLQESGEYVTGGFRGTLAPGMTDWQETLLMAEQSMFGSSIAPYRRSKENQYVKSLFHGAYRREVIRAVGFFDEDLGRTEDNDYHYRVRKAGYKICYSPKIESWQYVRSDFKKMLKQKYGNGYWVALTLKKDPKCLSIYHFVPFLFLVGIAVTTVLASAKKTFLAKLMWSLYWGLAITMSIFSINEKKRKTVDMLLLPFLFFLLHVSYGVGTLLGFLKIPFWKPRFNPELEGED